MSLPICRSSHEAWIRYNIDGYWFDVPLFGCKCEGRVRLPHMNFYMHRLDPKRRDSGYWEDFENLKQELMSVVSGDPASQSEHDNLQDAASLAANAGEEGTLPQNALDGNPFLPTTFIQILSFLVRFGCQILDPRTVPQCLSWPISACRRRASGV